MVGSHLLYSLIINNENVRAIHRKSSDLKAVKKVFSFYTNDAEMLFDKIERFHVLKIRLLRLAHYLAYFLKDG